MTLRIGAALDDARALWRRDRDLLLRLAGPFLFLPALAAFLLLPEFAGAAGGDTVAQQKALVDYYLDNAPWLIGQKTIELFGTLAILVLYLDRAHDTVGGALRRALALFPALLLAAVTCWAIFAIGIFAFVIPFFYAVGRLALVAPALVAERKTGPGEAIVRSFALTHGSGWALFGLLAAIMLAGLSVTFLVRLVGLVAGANPIAVVVVDALAAGIATLTVLARTLAAVALYRQAVTTR